jgi:hypothetical protein
VGAEFQVNTYTTGAQDESSVAMTADGGFVVTWESEGSGGTDTDSWSVQAQRFASDGTAVASEFQVNTYTTAAQRDPSLAVDPEGNFVAVWSTIDIMGPTLRWAIQARQYTSAGTALGPEFQVNSYTTGSQRAPSVAMGADGRFIVVWQSRGSAGTDTDGTSVQGQRYASTLIFADGFESADTSVWSATVPSHSQR